MKKTLLAMMISMFALMAGNNVQAQPIMNNPLFEGWYADPEGIVYDGVCWIYPTYSAPYEEQIFFDCFSSSDLVNWTKHERILDNTEIKWAWRAMWAPAVLKKDDKYYLFFGANDVHQGEVGGIGVAWSDKPEGPYQDLLGKPLIQDVVNGAQPIDQFVFKDDDGSYYMYYGGWGQCNMVKLKDDFTGLLKFDDNTTYKKITPSGYTEGPFMFKKDGKYYFMWSEGGWTGPDYSVAYAIADSPFGPFNRIATVLKPDPHLAMGAGHHSVICMPDGNWYMVYHRRPAGYGGANERVTCIDRMYFNEDGTIRPIVMDETIYCAPKLTPVSAKASNQLANETGAMAMDGDLDTKWCSGGTTTDKFLQYTFSEEVEICQWKVIHSGSEGAGYITRDFSLQRQDENKKWVNVDVVTNNTRNQTTRNIEPIRTTAVRLNISYAEQNAKGAARIREFELYGKPVGTSIETVNTENAFRLVGTYPNPMTDKTSIRFTTPIDCSQVFMNIFTPTGTNIFSQEYTVNGGVESEIVWNKGSFASGIYFFTIQHADNSELSLSGKLIVK